MGIMSQYLIMKKVLDGMDQQSESYEQIVHKIAQKKIVKKSDLKKVVRGALYDLMNLGFVKNIFGKYCRKNKEIFRPSANILKKSESKVMSSRHSYLYSIKSAESTEVSDDELCSNELPIQSKQLQSKSRMNKKDVASVQKMRARRSPEWEMKKKCPKSVPVQQKVDYFSSDLESLDFNLSSVTSDKKDFSKKHENIKNLRSKKRFVSENTNEYKTQQKSVPTKKKAENVSRKPFSLGKQKKPSKRVPIQKKAENVSRKPFTFEKQKKTTKRVPIQKLTRYESSGSVDSDESLDYDLSSVSVHKNIVPKKQENMKNLRSKKRVFSEKKNENKFQKKRVPIKKKAEELSEQSADESATSTSSLLKYLSSIESGMMSVKSGEHKNKRFTAKTTVGHNSIGSYVTNMKSCRATEHEAKPFFLWNNKKPKKPIVIACSKRRNITFKNARCHYQV